jgi:hypothetical protein
MYGMSKSMLREIKENEDVTDIVAKCFAFIAIPSALFIVIFALWTIFMTPGTACGPGFC